MRNDTSKKFSLCVTYSKGFFDPDYPSVSTTELREEVSTKVNEPFSYIYAGGLISSLLKFLEDNGVDSLKALAYAIENLGEAADNDGNATIFMGTLFEPAQEIVREDFNTRDN